MLRANYACIVSSFQSLTVDLNKYLTVLTYSGGEGRKGHCRIHEQSTEGVQRRVRHAATKRRTKRRYDDQDGGSH